MSYKSVPQDCHPKRVPGVSYQNSVARVPSVLQDLPESHALSVLQECQATGVIRRQSYWYQTFTPTILIWDCSFLVSRISFLIFLVILFFLIFYFIFCLFCAFALAVVVVCGFLSQHGLSGPGCQASPS